MPAPIYNKEREAAIRHECRGKAMVNAHLLYELFDTIREMEKDRALLAKTLLEREHHWRDLDERKDEVNMDIY